MTAPKITAVIGLITRVPTTVAIAFAASFHPLAKSNKRAKAVINTTKSTGSIAGLPSQEFCKMMPSITLATSSQRSVAVSKSA